MVTSNNIFNLVYTRIENVLPFQENWNNGTEYLDGATKVSLAPGQVAKSTTENDRKVILIGTVFGTVVVFERYPGGADNIYKANWPRAVPSVFVQAIGAYSSLSKSTIETIIGYGNCGPTINDVFERLFEEFRHLEKEMVVK